MEGQEERTQEGVEEGVRKKLEGGRIKEGEERGEKAVRFKEEVRRKM